MKGISKFYKLADRGTTARTEIIAGITTFMTMAYVLVVQPGAICGYGDAAGITDVNGVFISKEAIMVSCAFVSGFITLLMSLYADLPFALSTGMGSNFMFGTMIQSQTMPLGGAMAITLVSGIIFVLLTVFGVRSLIVKAIPKSIKTSIGTAIGFYIAYLGFTNSGICVVTDGSISLGSFTDPAMLLALAGIVLIGVLTALKVRGSILIGIVAITLLGIPFGVTAAPSAIAKVPDMSGLGAIIFNFDWSYVLQVSSLTLIFIVFFGDFFSTLGTVLGVSAKAGMLDENGEVKDIQKPFLVDAIGTCVGACTGNTTITTFVESSAGVEAGGRTGLTSLTTSILFFVMIFFSPLVLSIPDAATGPALIFVGFLMISGIKELDFSDFSEVFGPVMMILFTIFGAGIAGGISMGILAYILIKVLTGKYRDVHPFMYVLAIPLVLYFVVK